MPYTQTHAQAKNVYAALDKRISHNVKSQRNRVYAQLAAAGNVQREIFSCPVKLQRAYVFLV